jgi:signal transduction histidine kinase
MLRGLTKQFAASQRVLREEGEKAALAQERARIARDLHDLVGARLTGVALLAEREQKTQPQLAVIQDTIRICLEEIRDVAGALSQERRDMSDVIATLRRRAEDLAEAARMTLTLEANDASLPATLDAGTSFAILAIAREALANVVKHSNATRVSVCVARDPDQHLRLEVSDNGRGLPEGQPSGRGLENMRARVRERRGSFALKTTEQGVSVKVRLPLWA